MSRRGRSGGYMRQHEAASGEDSLRRLGMSMKRALSLSSQRGCGRPCSLVNRLWPGARPESPGDSLPWLIRHAKHFSQLLPENDLCRKSSTEVEHKPATLL